MFYMASESIDALKNSIKSQIYSNDQQAITGNSLQGVLIDMVDTLNASQQTVTVDGALDLKSNNPIANKPMAAKFQAVDQSVQTAIDTANMAKSTADANTATINNATTNITKLQTDVSNLKAGTVTVDSALDDNSVNPVQNKVVKAAIDTVTNTANTAKTQSDSNKTAIDALNALHVLIAQADFDKLATKDTTKIYLVY